MVDYNKQILFVYSQEDSVVTLTQHDVGRELASIGEVLQYDKYQESHGMKPLGYYGNIVTREGMYKYNGVTYVKDINDVIGSQYRTLTTCK